MWMMVVRRVGSLGGEARRCIAGVFEEKGKYRDGVSPKGSCIFGVGGRRLSESFKILGDLRSWFRTLLDVEKYLTAGYLAF